MTWSYADYLLRARCASFASCHRSRAALLAVCALLAGARSAAALQPQPERLAPATATIDGEFTRIRSVRELADGRMLYTDPGQTMLGVINWRTGDVRQVGREGRGPGEYLSAYGLHALAGDSTLVEDTRNGRWLVLHGARVAGTIDYSVVRKRELPLATSSTARGVLLTARPYAFRPFPDGWRPVTNLNFHGADSVLVALEHPHTGRIDTIARLRGAHRGLAVLQMPSPRGGTMPHYVGSPVGVAEQAIVFSDDWIAFVRIDPYRVDWRRPDGRWIRGAPLPFTAVPMDRRQKEAALRREHSLRTNYTVDDFPGWPTVLPPFTQDALLPTPEGHLAIRRMPDATRPGTFYDVVDRAGRLVRRLALAPNEQLIGIGRQAAYVVVTDDLDVQTLRRHPWRSVPPGESP